MFRRHYNLLLMGFWIVIAAGLLAPDLILPENVRRQFGGPGGTLAGVLALTFALYNLVRWWAYQSLYRHRATTVNPLSVRRFDSERGERYELNSDLDFLKVPDADKPMPPPEPSANGDQKT
ncbi:MAG: hypothetical protein JWO38_5862 [Gemmataceae bacterium]|nr:hypothetical protein [Gemmataceae bacterium]